MYIMYPNISLNNETNWMLLYLGMITITAKSYINRIT